MPQRMLNVVKDSFHYVRAEGNRQAHPVLSMGHHCEA